MTKRLSREATGEIVFDIIAEAEDNERWCASDIAAYSRLTVHQVRRGIEYIKDVLAGEYAEPLTTDSTLGYRFAESRIAAEAYERLRMRVLLTQVSRLMTGTVEPTVAKFKSTQARRIMKQVTRLREDVEDLVSDLT